MLVMIIVKYLFINVLMNICITLPLKSSVLSVVFVFNDSFNAVTQVHPILLSDMIQIIKKEMNPRYYHASNLTDLNVQVMRLYSMIR